MKVVIPHHNADLDALACVVAATRLYSGCVGVMPSLVSPPVHRYLALHKDHYPLISVNDFDPAEVAEVVVVDVRDRRRLKDFEAIFEKAERVVVYDHHPSSEHDLDADELTVEPLGACVTLLIERLRAAGETISAEEATLFMLGIYADTGRLSFSRTTPRDVEAAAYLLSCGAHLKVVNRYLRRQYDDDQQELLVALMASAEETSVEGVEVAFAEATTASFVRGASSAVEQVLEFGGHDALFGIVRFEKNDRVQVIGRSRVSYVDVGAILSQLGGGGHPGAAAATFKKATIPEVREKLMALLREHPMHPVRVADIMSSPVHFLQHDTTLRETADCFREWVVTGAPVLRDGELCGVISRRDVLKAQKADKLDLPVSSHMTHQVTCVAHDEPIEDTLELMTAEDIGRMPVTKDGEIAGIVTRTDLIRRLYMKQRDDSDLEFEG